MTPVDRCRVECGGSGGPPRRHGLSALAMVVALLAVLSCAALLQYGMSMASLSEVHRAELAGMARLQAASGIDELLARVAVDLNDPSAALFRKLREILDDPITEVELEGARGRGGAVVGALLVPEPPPGGIKAEGVLRYDPELYAAYPPKQTLKKSHRGDYVVAVSPAPVMADGGAR